MGVESQDHDGDGIGQWEDVDEIELISPLNGVTITTLPLCLSTNIFNPDVVASYWIQISLSDSDFESSVVFSKDDFTTNECEIPVGIIAENVAHYWRAKAFDGSKWSEHWSVIRSFIVNVSTNVPIFPSPSSGSSIADTTPLLDWENVTDATGYRVQVNTDASFNGTMIADNDTLSTSQYQMQTALSDNTTYHWRVKVKNTFGIWGAWSDTWSFTIQLPSPSGPSPADGSTIFDTTPLLDWNDIAGTSGYHVQLNTIDSFSGTMIVEDDTLSASQYQVQTVLADDTTYFWRVKLRNMDGVWGEWGSTWSFTVGIPSPSTPSPADGNTILDTTPLLDWEDFPGISGYRVQVNTNGDFSGTMIADDDTLITSEYPVLTVLSDSSTYYWRVRVKNAVGVWGGWSNIWSFTVQLPTPSAPSPPNGSTIFDTTPLLDWDDTVGPTGYHVQVSTNSSFGGTLTADDDTLSTSEYTVQTALTHGTIYYWHVKMQNADGVWGQWSSTWSFTVELPSPSIPYPESGSALIDTTPLLDWEDIDGVIGCHVQVNTNDTFTGTMIVDDDTLTTSHYQFQTILSDNATYFWHVRVQNEDSVWGGWSETWYFGTDIPYPSAPVPRSGRTIFDTTPLFDWEDVPGASGYHVQLNSNSSFSGTMIADDDTLSASQYQVLTTLSDNVTYYWRVRVKNTDDVWGDWSNIWRLTEDVDLATAVIDQQQQVIDKSVGSLVIGGASDQILAQVVTVGISGSLVGVRMPIYRSSGELCIEIQGVTDDKPNGVVMTSETFDETNFPSKDLEGFAHFLISTLVDYSVGDKLAIVVSCANGYCSMWQGPTGNPYPGGNGYFDSRPNTPGEWVLLSRGPDLTFKTLVRPP